MRQRETHTDKEKEIVDTHLFHIDTCRESRLEIIQFFETVDGFELSIEMNLFDVGTKGIIRDKGTDRNIDDCIGLGALFFSRLDFFDFLFEEFEVETHADIFRFSGLTNSEHIAHSSDFHITKSYLKSRSEMRMIRDSHESLSCIISEFRITIEKITHALYLASTDTTTELVELSKSEVLCFIDDNRIGIEEVDTIFDDGRREEDIVHPEFEFHDAVFEFVRWELTMRDDDFCFWHERLDFFFENWKSFNRIVNKKYFATTSQLLRDSPLYNRLVIASDSGLNWFFSCRWCAQNREMFDTRECEIERTRNRCRRERECIDACFEVHDFFFIRHTEFVFFIDDDETEISEFDIG
jgi:hypothetical protein